MDDRHFGTATGAIYFMSYWAIIMIEWISSANAENYFNWSSISWQKKNMENRFEFCRFLAAVLHVFTLISNILYVYWWYFSFQVNTFCNLQIIDYWILEKKSYCLIDSKFTDLTQFVCSCVSNKSCGSIPNVFALKSECAPH